MLTKSCFISSIVSLGIVCVVGCVQEQSKPTAGTRPQQSTVDSATSGHPSPAKPTIIEVPQDVVEAITKKRMVKPEASPPPTAAEIADWSLPQGPAFELIFQHRVKRGGPVIAHPDGKSFFHAGDRLARWQIGSDEPQTIYHESSTSNITAVAISEKQNKLIAGDDQDTLRIWDIDSGELLSTRKQKLGKNHRSVSAITGVAVSPDGKTIAATAKYAPVEFYDSMLQPKEMSEINTAQPNLFFLDENLLVLMGEETEVWDIHAKKRISRFASRPLSHGPPVSPSGSSFTYKTFDGFMQWNGDEPDRLLDFPTDGDKPDTLIYSPDGKLLIQAASNWLEIIDVASRTRRQIWDTSRLTGICWIPDSDLFVTTSAKGLIRIVGTPESASKFGLTPIIAKKVAEFENTSIPPTVAQLKAITDFRELPKLPRFMPTTDYHFTTWYQTPVDLPEVRKFYRHVFSTCGWKEVAAEQQGLLTTNMKFQRGDHSLILHTHRTHRNRSYPKNLVGGKPGNQIAINEKVTDVSLTLTDYFDMQTIPIYESTSWELVEERNGYLRYRTSDSIVASELELLRTFPPSGWVFLDDGSNSSEDRRNLRFAKNGCVIQTAIHRDRAKKEAWEIEMTRGIRKTMPIPPDSKFLSLRGLLTAKSELNISDLRVNFDSQMQENGWTSQWLDTEGLRRNVYTKGLQEVVYRFAVDEDKTTVTVEPDRESSLRNNENWKAEVRAVTFPTPEAIAPPEYGRVVDRTKAIEFVSSNSWEQLRTQYSEFLNARGYKCKPTKKEMDTLYFKNDRNRVRIQFEPQADGLKVIIDGRLKWPNPLPSAKPMLRNYSNWLELKGRDFSLDHLDEFEGEMLKILDPSNQTESLDK